MNLSSGRLIFATLPLLTWIRRTCDNLSSSLSFSPVLIGLSVIHLYCSLLESVQRVSRSSAVSVEQILRTVESFMIDIDSRDTGDSSQQAINKSSYLHLASQLLADVTIHLSIILSICSIQLSIWFRFQIIINSSVRRRELLTSSSLSFFLCLGFCCFFV